MNKIKQVAAKLKNKKIVYCPHCKKQHALSNNLISNYCNDCLNYFLELKEHKLYD